MKKIEVLNILKDMPDEFSADDLIGHIFLLQKIDAGLLQINEGKVYSKKETEKKLNKTPNSLTAKTIEDAHNGIGVGKPIIDITSYINSL